MLEIETLRIKPIFYHSQEYSKVRAWCEERQPILFDPEELKQAIFATAWYEERLLAVVILLPIEEHSLAVFQNIEDPDFAKVGLTGVILSLIPQKLSGGRWRSMLLPIAPEAVPFFKSMGYQVSRTQTEGLWSAKRAIPSPPFPIR